MTLDTAPGGAAPDEVVRRGGSPPPGAAPEPDPFAGTLGLWFKIAIVAVVVVGLVGRFVARSPLWLDEALTVNIAKHPLGDLHTLLRHDGAPPLYYLLLHYWMKVFGTSDLGARSLSGLVGVLVLPAAWFAGRRLGGPDPRRASWVAWGTLLVVASSPFAARYATEVRMYGLEILWVLLGYLALTAVIERPTLVRLAAVAVLAALLLYTQYWAIYLLVVVGAGLVFAARDPRVRRAALRGLGAIVVGFVLWLPWVPTFLYQAEHTGTPWATPMSIPTGTFTALQEFAGSDHTEGFVLLALIFVLSLLALFARSRGRVHLEVDLRTQPGARWVWYVAGATLVGGLAAAQLSHGAFQGRYAAIVFGLVAMIVAYGVVALGDRGLRYGALGLVVLVGLLGVARNSVTDRTQAKQIADVINSRARPGDTVIYCPDQVGPDVARLVKPGLHQLTFPTAAGPDIVNWVDYAKRNTTFRLPGVAGNLASPRDFAAFAVPRAGDAATIWYVWSPAYRTYGHKCEDLVGALAAQGRPARTLVQPDDALFEEQGLITFPGR